MYKVLILKNDRLDTKSAYLKAKKYFADNKIDVSFFEKEVDELVSVHEYLKREGYDTKLGKVGGLKQISYLGLDDIVKNNNRKYVKEGEYDCVIFSWDTDTLNHPLLGTEVVTSFVQSKGLYPTTEWIQLAINQYDIPNDKVWLKVTHELMHAFCKTLLRKNIVVADLMDSMGENDNPYSLTGNYAYTLSNIKPYISKLYKTTDHFKTQEFVPKAIYDKFGENSNWFIDPRIRKLANFVRTFFNKPVTINNWSFGGTFEQRGFRTDDSVGAEMSQHRYGRAIDINIKDMSPQEVFLTIMANEKLFIENGLTCMEDIKDTPSWNHLDIRFTGLDKILIVRK